MTVLSDPDRSAVCNDFQRDRLNVNGAAGGLTKAQILLAVNAADDWADNNAAAFNAALPVAARTTLSGQQKAALLLFVIRRRWELS